MGSDQCQQCQRMNGKAFKPMGLMQVTDRLRIKCFFIVSWGTSSDRIANCIHKDQGSFENMTPADPGTVHLEFLDIISNVKDSLWFSVKSSFKSETIELISYSKSPPRSTFLWQILTAARVIMKWIECPCQSISCQTDASLYATPLNQYLQSCIKVKLLVTWGFPVSHGES